MIRIERGIEADLCPELIELRREELSRLRKLLADGVALNEDILGTKYRVARPALYTLQAHKCCYCEAIPNSERWRHVEHFRPKLEARRSEGHVELGYWWLTWTWDNLLFACMDCNNAKRSKFPLAEGSPTLCAEDQAPGEEIALLVDPASEDPRVHLQFRPLAGRWIPIYRSARGKAMLEALGWLVEPDSFKQDGLVDKWQQHVEGMQDRIAALRAAFANEDPFGIAAVWADQTRYVRRASALFVALSLDVSSTTLAPRSDITIWT